MEKKWVVKKEAPKDWASQFPEYSAVEKQLLFNRGLESQAQIDQFLNPDYSKDLRDPFLIFNMDKAVDRIMTAVKKNEKVVIYGDYDADGVSGTIVLESALRTVGIKNIVIYIPDRSKEGYGLNEKAVREIAATKQDLIITVDCGVSDVKEVKLANSLGLEVMIFDHHLTQKKIPECYTMVNVHQPKDKYPFKFFSAAGLVFKIVQALQKKTGLIPPGQEKWLLDLVAISTTADFMPLLDENRALVKYGLLVLAQSQRLGLRALMDVSKIDSTFDEQNLTTNLSTETITWMLAPRLNSASRMDHANTAYRLLTTSDLKEAREIAGTLDTLNRQRQKKVEEVLSDADKKLPEKVDKVIFEGQDDWPIGLMGLAAMKLRDRYYRPVFLYGKNDKEFRGSVRSIPSFNIVEAMTECAKDIKGIIEFGGHPQAGGFGIKDMASIEEFKKSLNKYAESKIKKDDLIPQLDVEVEVSPQDINWNLFEAIEHFAPFGHGNLEPTFLIKNLQVQEKKLMGATNKHLRLALVGDTETGKKTFKAMAFNQGQLWEKISVGGKMDVVFSLEADTWNGQRNLFLKVEDLKISN